MDEQISTDWIRLGGGPDGYVTVPRDGDPLGAVGAGAGWGGLVTYPDAAHGFANAERPDTYDAAAVGEACRRTRAALRERVAAA